MADAESAEERSQPGAHEPVTSMSNSATGSVHSRLAQWDTIEIETCQRPARTESGMGLSGATFGYPFN